MSALPNVWRTSCTPLLVLLLLSVQRGFCALTDTEKDFIEVPSPDSARESLQFITSKPHVAGTPGDHEVREKRGRGHLLPAAGRMEATTWLVFTPGTLPLCMRAVCPVAFTRDLNYYTG